MASEELEFTVDQLTYQLDARGRRHAEAVASLREEARALRRRLQEALERRRAPPPRERPRAEDAFVRSVEWRLADFSGSVRPRPRNEALWSEAFSVMGVAMQLEFFPQGRDTTSMPGFCAVFLWCPAGVHVRYQLRVGKHRSAPDTDEFASRMGHGHSNFCYLEAQRDAATDSVVVGVDILDLCVRSQPQGAEGLLLVNRGPEACLLREAATLTHRGLDRVEWRIRNIMKRVREVPSGSSICSPPFSLAGVREMLLELYPNGLGGAPSARDGAEKPQQQASPGKEGYCGFYVRCPPGNSLILTLFVGDAKKGPIKTDFDGNTSKGLPEFCRLEDQLPEGEEDLVVGVVVQNPQLEREEDIKEVRLA